MNPTASVNDRIQLIAAGKSEVSRRFEALGITVDPDSFVPMLQTASGPGYGARVTLDTLALGETEFTQVPAVVVRGLGVNLLGDALRDWLDPRMEHR